MTRVAVALFVLAGSLALARADEKALKELEGTYKLALAERDGKVADKELTDKATVTIKGDEFALAMGDDKKVAKIKVGGDLKQLTIDLSPTDGQDKGKTFAGIYKIEKGEITLAFSEKGDRPKEFKSDNEAVLLKLKKAEK
jgi:uncharacterized protein (TIGR03067 family)